MLSSALLCLLQRLLRIELVGVEALCTRATLSLHGFFTLLAQILRRLTGFFDQLLLIGIQAHASVKIATDDAVSRNDQPGALKLATLAGEMLRAVVKAVVFVNPVTMVAVGLQAMMVARPITVALRTPRVSRHRDAADSQRSTQH